MSDRADEVFNLVVTELLPLQSLYMNQHRVDEHFTTQIGAIASLAVDVDREISGTVDLKFISIGKQRTVGNQVSYDMTNPLARVLVLRAALDVKGRIHRAEDAQINQYVVGSGVMCIQGPDFVAPRLPDCLDPADPRMVALESDRAAVEAVRLAIGGPQPVWEHMWLLTLLEDGDPKLATVLSTAGIDPSMSSYAIGRVRCSVFGILRQTIEDVPMVSPIHVWIDLSEANAPAPVTG
jgi:hypothetical protein